MNNLANIQRLKQQPRQGQATPPAGGESNDFLDFMKTGLNAAGDAIKLLVNEQNQLIGGTGRLININQTLIDKYKAASKELLFLEERNSSLNKTFGLTVKQAAIYGQQLDVLSVNFKKGGEALRRYAEGLKTVIGNYKVVGRGYDAIGQQLLRTQEILTDSLGLSQEQAANFEFFAAGANKAGTDYLVTTNEIAQRLEASTGQQGLFKEITGDIADLTADLQIQYSKIPGTLEVATVKSKQLGLSVAQLNRAGQNLLNIESSIGQELEYQLLSGRRLIKQGKSLTNEFRVAQLRGDASKQADLMNQILEQEGETLENNLFARQQMSQLLGMDEAVLARSLQKKKILEKIGGEALFNVSGKELFAAAQGLGASAEDLKALAQETDTRSTEKILMDIEDQLITKGIKLAIPDQVSAITGVSTQSREAVQNLSNLINVTGPTMATVTGYAETVISKAKAVTDTVKDLADAYGDKGIMGVVTAVYDKIVGTTMLGTGNKPLSLDRSVVEEKAIGGPVAASTPYLVGEVGPELFVPNTAGTIIPNNQLSNTTAAADPTALANAIVAAFQAGVKLEVKIDPTFTGSGMNQGRYTS
jgi:hypothetical protein